MSGWSGRSADALEVHDLHVEVVALLQTADEVGVGPLPIPLRDLLHGLWLCMGESAHFLEEVLKASWTDELDNNNRLIRRVPQGMHDAARLEQEPALADLRLLLANQPADPTSVDECELVLPFVTVRHDESSRSEHSRLRREPSARVIGRDQLPEDGARDRWPVVPGDGSSRHDVHQDADDAGVVVRDSLARCQIRAQDVTVARRVSRVQRPRFSMTELIAA